MGSLHADEGARRHGRRLVRQTGRQGRSRHEPPCRFGGARIRDPAADPARAAAAGKPSWTGGSARVKPGYWVAALALASLAFPAAAGPPYLTDDPVPTDLGRWEIYGFASGEGHGSDFD